MKISNILIALTFVFAAACSGKKSDHEHSHDAKAHEHSNDNEHSHDGEEGHAHDDDSNHEQEEFTVKANSSEITTSNKTEVDPEISKQENEVTIEVPAKKGVEYKFHLKQYEKLTYEWTAEKPLYFDFHGEPLDYEKTKYFESFTEGISNKMKGIMTTPFEGSHGWYWKNETDKVVSVTLKTKGNYRIIGLKK